MIVFQINKFFWLQGGAERYLFMVSDALEERGHQVVHFSMAHPNNRPSPYSKYFVTRRDYDDPGTSGLISHGAQFIRSREARDKIRALMRDHKPDVAHLHNIYHQLTPSIIDALADEGVPVVMTLHDYKLTCPNYCHFAHGEYCYRCQGGKYYQAALVRCSRGSFARSALLSAEAYWQRSTGVYGRVRRFLAPSRFMRDRLTEAAPYVGVNGDRVRYLPSFCPAPEATQELGAEEKNILDGLPERFVLYFGRLSQEKGVDTLLEAAETLASVPFVICGEGPLKSKLEQRAGAEGSAANVTFTGHVNKPLLDRIIARACAVALPAVWPENAPFTVIEAAAMGTPLIVSDMGGLPEMARIVSGLVFPHGDGKALAAKIRYLWDNPEAARERGEKGKHLAVEYFDKTRHMDSLEKVYEEAANSR